MKVKKFGELYEVFEDGIIVDVRTKEAVNQYNSGGYRHVFIYGRVHGVHRVVAELFCTHHKGRDKVNHIDGDKENNHFTNLEWVTVSENNKHAYDTGLKTPIKEQVQGSNNGRSLLTEADVLAIRASDAKYKDLAVLYGVHPTTITHIKKRLTWKHI